ncbi:MAG: choice-of-anchor J domain-containing protein, partial [Bacteroidales bacterium]
MKTFSPLIFSVLFLASFSMDAQKQSSQNAIPLYKVAKIQDCIGSPSAKAFPYIPNFGTSEKPTDESTYWSQQFPLGEDPAIQKWSYQAIPGEGTNLAIYYPGIDMSSVDANPNLYSHCLSLKNSEKYKLSFTIVSTQEASINHLKVWLAPQKGTDGFEQLGILSPTALIGNFNNISKGSLQCVDLLLDKNQIPTDGVYAIAIELLSDMGQGPVYIKEFKVEKFTTADHALGALVAPLSACNLTQSEIIKLRFKNKGLDPVQQLTVYYQVDGATPVKEDFVLPNLVTQQEALLSFKTPANLAKKKTYTLRAWIDKNPNDENQTNDTLKNIFISNTTTSQIPPFSTDFTALEREGWNILAKNFESTNTWTFQGHNGNECATINTASDTVNDWLISPCISLEAGKTYRVHFWYKALSNMGEHLQLNMSTNINNPNQGVPIWTGEEFTSILGGEINAEGYMEATTYFTSTQSANYYLGFKAYSKGTRRGISIDKVGMEEMPVGSIPFNQGFEEDKINKDIAIVDVNRDQVTWQIKTDPLAAYNSTKYAEIKGHVAGDGSDGHAGNDWLFTNPVTLEKGKEYRLSYRVSGSEKDSLKIVLVTSYNYKVADTSRDLSWKAIPTGNAYERKTQLFTAPATTAYSVAFKYYGAPNKNATVRLDNILISDPKLVNDTNMILTEVLLPPNAAAGISQEVLTLKYKSLTNEVLEVGNVRFYYQLNDDPLVSMLAPVDIQAYANGSIDFTNNKIDFTKGSIFKIKAWISCHGDKHPENDSLSLTIKVPEPQKIPIKLD